jgi:hypothetical protein
MFQRAIRGHSLPKYLSSDHDPLYRFHQWEANLRILEVTEIKTVPYVPLSRAPQRRSITSGGRTHPRPTQGGCWLNLVACERPSRVTG